MNEQKEYKEKMINDYMSSNIDVENIDDIDIEKIKEDLHSLLGEIPAIELSYEAETPILEDGSKSKRRVKLKSVNVAYTFEDGNQNRYSKLTYVIG